MIVPEILYALLVADIVFTIYAWLDTDNRLYTNIIALVFAAVISFYIAIALVTGTTAIHDVVTVATASNTTGNWTNVSYVYTDDTFALQNPGLMWLAGLLGILQTIFVMLMVADAVVEYRLSEVEE
jgi:hypothetical protein